MDIIQKIEQGNRFERKEIYLLVMVIENHSIGVFWPYVVHFSNVSANDIINNVFNTSLFLLYSFNNNYSLEHKNSLVVFSSNNNAIFYSLFPCGGVEFSDVCYGSR
ncbi:MAG: hypothetical protein ACYTFM_10570, partial [Planctomycetota bacterium]